MKKRLFCLLMILILALLQTAFSTGVAEEAGSWVCESCGATNTGSFCEECGAAKPGWTCICGSRNEKKFCPVCGTSYDTLTQTYAEAVTAFNSGDIQTAAAKFEYLREFSDSAAYLEKCRAQMPSSVSTPAPSNNGIINFDDPSYNPQDEEGGENEAIVTIPGVAETTPAPTMSSIYAGATPVVIDPINKPTPTPVPRIEFKDSDYTTYEVPELHLSFQGPAGWFPDGPTSWDGSGDMQDTFILTNPDSSLDYAGQIKIRVVPVNGQYSKSDLDKEVKAVRDTLRSDMGFSKFDNYDVASYNFLKTQDTKSSGDTIKYKFIDNKGRYTRFKGTLKENGAKIGGRIIVNYYNKNLYILVCCYPGGDLQEAFEDVYRKVRDTLIITE